LARVPHRSTAAFIIAILGIAARDALLNLMLPPESPFHVPLYIVSLWGKYACYALRTVDRPDLGLFGILLARPRRLLRARRLRDGHVPDAPDRHRGVLCQPVLPDFMVFLNWDHLPFYWWGIQLVPTRW